MNARFAKFLSGSLMLKKGEHTNLINIVRTTTQGDEQTNHLYPNNVVKFNPLSRGTPVHFYSVYRQQSKIEDQDRIFYLKERSLEATNIINHLIKILELTL